MSADAPIDMVVTLLVARQLSSVPVIDEFGVQVGVLSMSGLLADADNVEPAFAGLARRRWYHLPAHATAGDFMIRAAAEPGRAEARAAGGPEDGLPAAS